jgi:hypothetical protein
MQKPYYPGPAGGAGRPPPPPPPGRRARAAAGVHSAHPRAPGGGRGRAETRRPPYFRPGGARGRPRVTGTRTKVLNRACDD